MSPTFSLAGKRIVVVGAASGLGFACATLAQSMDAEVISLDWRSMECGSVRIQLDLGDEASIDAAIAEVQGPVDAVLLPAGVSSGSAFSADTIMRINYLGIRAFAERIVPKVRAGSAMVLVTSHAAGDWQDRAKTLLPLVRLEAYDEALAWMKANPDRIDGYPTAKQALNLWATVFAASASRAHDVHVNVISPGVADTQMISSSRLGSREELIARVTAAGGRLTTPLDNAKLMLFLASDWARMVRGQFIIADGGRDACARADALAGSVRLNPRG